MSRSATVTVIFPDQERKLRLGIGQLEILQEKTGRGPEALLTRLNSGEWFVDELVETIRQALLGAGEKPGLVDKLIKTYVVGPKDDPLPLGPSKRFAQAALWGVLIGTDQEEIDKPPENPAAPGEKTTLTESSSSASSTDRELPSSDGPQSKSVN